MRGLIRTFRSFGLAAGLVGSLLAFAEPASALQRSIEGLVVAPVASYSAGYTTTLDGVVIDPAFGPLQFHYSAYSRGCSVLEDLRLTALDGSVLTARGMSCTGTSVLPGLAYAQTYDPLTITGGTGQFNGATGSGRLDITHVFVPALLLNTQVSTGSIDLSFTTT